MTIVKTTTMMTNADADADDGRHHRYCTQNDNDQVRHLMNLCHCKHFSFAGVEHRILHLGISAGSVSASIPQELPQNHRSFAGEEFKRKTGALGIL